MQERVRTLVFALSLGCSACSDSCGCARSAATSSAATPAPTPAPSLGARIALALDKVTHYLEQQKLRGDQAWLIAKAAAALGKDRAAWAAKLPLDPSVVEAAKRDPKQDLSAIEGAMAHLGRLPSQPLPPLAAPKVEPKTGLSRRFETADGEHVIELMRSAIVCDANVDDAAWDPRLLSLGQGYLLTHQLLSVTLAYERGCVSRERALHWRQLLAAPLLAEVLGRKDPLDDLAIERLAVLCYAGLCDWIPRADIEALLAQQGPTGTWGSHGPENMSNIDWEAHTAALGFYTLAELSVRAGAQ